MAGGPGIGSLTRFVTARSVGALSLAWRVSLDVVVSQQLIERTVNRLLSSGVAERIAERVLAGPELDRIVERALDDGRLEAILERIAHSETFDRLLDQALASEELDRVVTQIAESDEVRAALHEQSAGMADDVADQLRVRAMAGDMLLERFARSLIRRRR